MAVEARGVDPFPTPIISNSDFIASKNTSATRLLPSQAEDFIPLSMTETTDTISCPKRRRHRRQELRIIPQIPTVKSSGKDNCGSTGHCCTAAFSVPGNHHKRSRDVIGDDHLNGDRFSGTHNPHKMSKASPFQIPGHSSEFDRMISQYIQDFAQKLKQKDEEIRKIGRLNCRLEEKVRSLSMENQIWRGLVENNEVEADDLRRDLQRALSRGGFIDDEESCCGSNYPKTAGAEGGDAATESWMRGQCCKSGLLLLPCSHLYAACGPAKTSPTTRNCPGQEKKRRQKLGVKNENRRKDQAGGEK